MNNNIRILHVLTGMDLAGTETLLMNLYRKIDRTKVQFDFAVTASKECAYDQEILRLGGRIIHYPLYRGVNHFAYVKWWKEFFANHPEYHIVHGHIGSTAAIYLSIAKKYGCYTIAHSHSTYGPMSLHTLLYKVYSYPTRFIADYFMGCSKDALVDRYGKQILESKNRFILNNGIDAKKYVYSTEVRNAVRSELGIKNSTIVLGTVGRLTPQKNPQFTIKIIKEMEKKKIDWQFLWVGTGELEKEIKEQLRPELENRLVIMTGSRMDVNRILQAMDIFIFPSIYEGLGIAGIEAQAADLPTLCSEGLPRELKITERCTFLPINDLKVWIEKIETIIRQNQYKNRIDRYEEIKSMNYDIDSMAHWLQNFYLLHERKNGYETI